MIGVGPILGPVVGGMLLSSVGRHWLFWINLPLCAVGLVLCARLRGATHPGDRSLSCDALGNALLAGGVSALLVGLSLWPRQGIGDPSTMLWLVAGAALLSLALVREHLAADPALELAWFRSRAFSTALFATFAFGAAAAVVFIVPPFLLGSRLHFAPWQIGLVGMSAPFGLVVASKWSGPRVQQRGTRHLMKWGLLLMAIALAGLVVSAGGEEVAVMVVLLLVFGVGGGLFQLANIAEVMAAATAAKQATIGAAQRMVQNVGIALGATVSAALLTAAHGRGANAFDAAMSQAWAFAGVAILVSLIAFLPRGSRRGTPPTSRRSSTTTRTTSSSTRLSWTSCSTTKRDSSSATRDCDGTSRRAS